MMHALSGGRECCCCCCDRMRLLLLCPVGHQATSLPGAGSLPSLGQVGDEEPAGRERCMMHDTFFKAGMDFAAACTQFVVIKPAH